ncbi:hypothetical protein E5Q_06455 [Mixia osmundae IAM 14324]|uniref:Zn(2)-C6 fungal-type domain-containing protein n=1 Tax=Mixia osmundae (strain CBS 9802 / IAM 14324 / JCM 22182 / KY 12970) TaxID=764103 RepID=G7EA92_MIXOS|nr:hypothetical protein E5Q_06455 [Mixia osmundae IAM 14324]
MDRIGGFNNLHRSIRAMRSIEERADTGIADSPHYKPAGLVAASPDGLATVRDTRDPSALTQPAITYSSSVTSSLSPPEPVKPTTPSTGASVAESADVELPSDKQARRKKRIERKSASCNQCRRKKLRCDRLYPCGSCTSRKTDCVWEGAVPLLTARDINDAVELRAKVEQLQAIVDRLTQARAEAVPTFYPDAPEQARPGYHAIGTGSSNNTSGSSMSSGRAASSIQSGSSTSTLANDRGPREEQSTSKELHDLKANDLCETLSHMVISQVVQFDVPRSKALKECRLVTEAQERMLLPQAFGYCDNNLPPPQSLPADANAMLAIPFGSTNVRIEDLINKLPTEPQMRSALSYYTRFIDWYQHAVCLPDFHRQWAEMRQAIVTGQHDRIDLAFMATFFGVCAMGVSMMPLARAIRDGLGADKEKLVDQWLEAAMRALIAGAFLTNPSLEAIRAIVILNTFYIFMTPAEACGSGMALLGMAGQLAFQLGLHRDPSHQPDRYTFKQAEDRRKTWWTLLSFEVLAAAALGRNWSTFDLSNVDTQFPQDANDDEITDRGIVRNSTGETIMSFLLIRYRTAVVSKSITDTAFGVEGVTYKAVLELERKIEHLEGSMPRHYANGWNGTRLNLAAKNPLQELRVCITHIAICTERMRLHRPFLTKGFTDPVYARSRHLCIKAARVFLAIHARACCRQNWGSLHFKSSGACIILLLELLQNPHNPEADTYRAEIKNAMSIIRMSAQESSCARKAIKILTFLSEKEAEVSQTNMHKVAKRARTNFDANDGLSTAIDPFALTEAQRARHSDEPQDSQILWKSTAPWPLEPLNLYTLPSQAHRLVRNPRRTSDKEIPTGLPTRQEPEVEDLSAYQFSFQPPPLTHLEPLSSAPGRGRQSSPPADALGSSSTLYSPITHGISLEGALWHAS